MLTQILTAFALVLVIEGLMPSINPGAWKGAMRQLLEHDSERIRQFGLGSMIVGALLLAIIH